MADGKPASEDTKSPTSSSADRLDSWKEIAAYLKREVRTVQRWEKGEGLPVHRHQHSKLGTVYAFKAELDLWWRSRRTRLDQQDQPEEVAQASAVPRGRHLPVLVARIVLLGVILAIGVYSVWQQFVVPTLLPSQRVMLAVLPFENMSHDPEQEYFSDGLTEELITHLARLNPKRLGVISRTSAMRFKNRSKSIQQIGRELGVDTVLEGSVRREGDRVRITAQLIRVSDQTHLWAQSYDQDLVNLLAVWSTLAGQIAQALAVEMLPVQARPGRRPTESFKAYEAYLRGRFFLNKRTIDGLNKGLAYFEQSAEEDPTFALAYAGQAEAYALLGSAGFDVLDPRTAMPKAKAAALKALELDALLSEAHTVLAYATMVYDWNWEEAEEGFLRAIALNPSYAEARHWYAYFLTAMGRSDEAIAEVRRSHELDPISLPVNASVGWHLYYARRYDEAITQFERTLELDPNFALVRFTLGMAYLQKGLHNRAITEFRQAADLGANAPLYLAALGHAHAVVGRRSEARQVLRELQQMRQQRFVPALYSAGIHAGLGQGEQAIVWLERAYQERFDYLLYLKVEPIFEGLHADPRFQDLLQRVGLPE